MGRRRGTYGQGRIFNGYSHDVLNAWVGTYANTRLLALSDLMALISKVSPHNVKATITVNLKSTTSLYLL
jgi:hypothetical protein